MNLFEEQIHQAPKLDKWAPICDCALDVLHEVTKKEKYSEVSSGRHLYPL